VPAFDLAVSSSVSNSAVSVPRCSASAIFRPALTSSAIAFRNWSRLGSAGGLSWLIWSMTPWRSWAI
jgi:hypothetical protein